MKNLILILIVFLAGNLFLNTDISFSQWTQVTDGMVSNNIVRSFVTEGNKIYDGTATGVFVSTNYGINWSVINNGLTLTNVNSLLISGNYLFAGCVGGIFVSTNSGSNWTQVLSNIVVNSLGINGPRIFAGTEGWGIYMSTNNGTNWQTVNNGVSDLYIKAFSGHSFTFAGSQSSGIYYTSDGSIWAGYNMGLTNFNIRTFSFSEPSLFYAGTFGGGVFLWMGGSTGWAPVNSGLNNSYINCLTSTGSVVLAGTNNAVNLSTNYGSNWTVKNEGFPTGYGILSLKIFDNYVFAGTAYQSVWRRNLSEMLSYINKISDNIPLEFSLHQNFPNPFNPYTIIKFEIPEISLINLSVYDATGKEIETLINKQLTPGIYQIRWNASQYAGGVYFYKLNTNNYSETRKLILLK